MSAIHLPGLDTFLTVPDEPRRPRYATPEEACDAIAAEILADRERVLALLEEQDSQTEEAELIEQYRELRLLLAAPDSDARSATLLERERKSARLTFKKLAEAQAKYQVDNA